MPTSKDICDAAYAGDIDKLRQLAAEGADFNETNEYGETILAEIMSNLTIDNRELRYAVLLAMLELGADPNILNENGCGVLTAAMLAMDTKMFEILLDAGVDPNTHTGSADYESFFDWAVTDYAYNLYGGPVPDKAEEKDRASEESWLEFLDRLALKYNRRRPDHLYLLRSYGALSKKELEQKKSESDSQMKG